jgi:hypothetical protein
LILTFGNNKTKCLNILKLVSKQVSVEKQLNH